MNLFRFAANRSDFLNPWLQSSVDFRPVEASPAAAAVRKFMRMDGAEDYFTIGPVLTLLGTPALLHEIPIAEINSTTVANVAVPQFSAPEGYLLVAGAEGAPRVNRDVSIWPFSSAIRLRYLDQRTARLNSGGLQEDVTARMSNGTLHVAWPYWTGIKGALSFGNAETWRAEADITLQVTPRNYPSAALCAALRNTSAWIRLLESVGFLSFYASATADPNERVGLITLALIRDTMARL